MSTGRKRTADASTELKRQVAAAAKSAREMAARGGLSPAETRDLVARHKREAARRGPDTPIVSVKPINKPPVFAEFTAIDYMEGHAVKVTGRLAVDPEGALVVRSLTLEPNDHPAAGLDLNFDVTTSMLRGVRIAAIREEALQQVLLRLESFKAAERFGWKLPSEAERRALETAAAVELPDRHPGRAGYPDEHYRRIALAYLDLLEQGHGRGILNLIANAESARLGRRVPRETVRDWVRTARERGFLTSGRAGRAGAQAGPNLYPPKNENATRKGN